MVDKKIKFLSYSYVIIWRSPEVAIPGFNLDVLRELFQKPELTHVDSTNNALIVSILHNIQIPQGLEGSFVIEPPITPFININNNNIQNFNPDLESLFIIHEKFRNLLASKIDFNSKFIPGQLGINIDLEYNLESGSSKEWFHKRLFGQLFEDEKLEGSLLSFRKVMDSTNLLNVTVQPRVNRNDTLYVSINDHFSVSPISQFQNRESFKEIFERSIEKINKNIVPILEF